MTDPEKNPCRHKHVDRKKYGKPYAVAGGLEVKVKQSCRDCGERLRDTVFYYPRNTPFALEARHD